MKSVLLILILFAATNLFSQSENTSSPGVDSCHCNMGGAEFPGGFQFFRDEVIKKTSQKVKPVNSGTCYIRFTINEEGLLVNPEVIRSVDPVFEKELLKNLPGMGKWIPACEPLEDPGFEEEVEREAPVGKCIATYYTAPFRIRVE